MSDTENTLHITGNSTSKANTFPTGTLGPGDTSVPAPWGGKGPTVLPASVCQQLCVTLSHCRQRITIPVDGILAHHWSHQSSTSIRNLGYCRSGADEGIFCYSLSKVFMRKSERNMKPSRPALAWHDNICRACHGASGPCIMNMRKAQSHSRGRVQALEERLKDTWYLVIIHYCEELCQTLTTRVAEEN